MAQVINTNIGALFAGAALNRSALALQTAQQRLSSGLRINSAKDDATGLAVATGYDTQIRGTNVAIRTANDGVSLAQTADGYLGQITENLQRISEVLVLAPAGNAETAALIAENSRINALVVNSSSVTVDGTGTQSTALGTKPTLVNTAAVPAQAAATALATATTSSGLAGTTVATAVAAAAADATAGAAAAIAAAALVVGATTASVVAAASTAGISSATLAKMSVTATAALAATAYTTNAALTATAGTDAAAYSVAAATAGVAFKSDVAANLIAVGASRASYGAVMSSLASAVATMQTTSVNLSAAFSRIMDTDYAAETTAMTRNNILQQAGTAVLAQANQTPNTVLTLLR